MNNSLTETFTQFGTILGICPDCAHIFYLSEARPYLVGKQRKFIVDRLRAKEHELARQEEALEIIEDELRERAAKAGLRTAKTLLRKIDPVFSGAGYDPQDVKVVFNPISYIVFQGMAANNLRRVRLLANPAADKTMERTHISIERAIDRGNYQFKVLRVNEQGQVQSE